MANLLRQLIHVARHDGILSVVGKAWRRMAVNNGKNSYALWNKTYNTLSAEDTKSARIEIDGFTLRPVISILMPVYNVDEQWLRKAIDSVRSQIYENWELCIADDYSSKPHVRRILEENADADQRIKLAFRTENGHISAASNSALEIVTGDFTALMDHDDELAPEALYFVAKEINQHPVADIIYSDEDKIGERDHRFDPQFKPDWSPDLFYSVNFISHLIVYRSALLRQIGGFRVGYEGSQDYDLALRAIEKTQPENIHHIPRVLYHWRAIRGSVALASEEKPYAHERARAAINEHFERTGINAKSVRGVGQLHRVIHAPPTPPPVVSIIVYGATKTDTHLKETLKLNSSVYPTEMIVIPADDGNLEPAESKYARLNAAARHASGEVLCFVDGSTTQASDGWLDVLTGHTIQKNTGAVGARIIYPNKRIKHAGFILGLENGVGRPNHNALSTLPGLFRRLDLAQNFSAVSIDCLAIKKSVFDEIGGFDTGNFPNIYADVDLCLRLLEAGCRNVWTPWAQVVQPDDPKESVDELEILKKKWAGYFEHDPYYNPNLTLETEDLSLASPPRIAKV